MKEPQFERKLLAPGQRIVIYTLTRDGEDEVRDFLRTFREDEPRQARALQEVLQYFADHFPMVHEKWLSQLEDHGGVWVIKRNQGQRLYGFHVRSGLYLCRFDMKRARDHDRRVTDSVRRAWAEWSEQYGE